MLYAGTISALTVNFLIHPFDTLGGRLQKESSRTSAARKTFWRNPKLYNGLY